MNSAKSLHNKLSLSVFYFTLVVVFTFAWFLAERDSVIRVYIWLHQGFVNTHETALGERIMCISSKYTPIPDWFLSVTKAPIDRPKHSKVFMPSASPTRYVVVWERNISVENYRTLALKFKETTTSLGLALIAATSDFDASSDAKGIVAIPFGANLMIKADDLNDVNIIQSIGMCKENKQEF